VWRAPTGSAPPAPFVPQRRLSRGDSQCTGHAARNVRRFRRLAHRRLALAESGFARIAASQTGAPPIGLLLLPRNNSRMAGESRCSRRVARNPVALLACRRQAVARPRKKNAAEEQPFCSPRRRVFQAGLAPAARGTCAADDAYVAPARVPKMFWSRMVTIVRTTARARARRGSSERAGSARRAGERREIPGPSCGPCGSNPDSWPRR
jgi:hypothetical protein